jgi:hypothetical protein
MIPGRPQPRTIVAERKLGRNPFTPHAGREEAASLQQRVPDDM